MVFRAKGFADYLNRRPLKNTRAYECTNGGQVYRCLCLAGWRACVFKYYTLHAQPLGSWWRPNYLPNIFGSEWSSRAQRTAIVWVQAVKREYVNLSCVF